MSELDERIANGLRELVDRAPMDADVWPLAERHIARHKQRRLALGAAAAIAVVAALTLAGVHSTTSKRTVHVASTTPAPTTRPTPPATTTPTSTPETTTPTTAASSAPLADPCSINCIGRATADVDGDGRADEIGLMATPPLSGDITASAPSKLIVRVAFADGRVSDYDDTAAWDASLLGAADVNNDGKAEIFYFNDTGASQHSGHILRWDGSHLAVVKGPDGSPYSLFIDGFAQGGTGFRCAGSSFITMTIQFEGTGNDPTNGWHASQTTDHWNGDQLTTVSENQPITIADPSLGTTGDFAVPPEYDQIIGDHCQGLPDSNH